MNTRMLRTVLICCGLSFNIQVLLAQATNQFIIHGQTENSGAPANPQGKVTLYYNQSWDLTTADKALYRREANLDLREITFAGLYKDYNKMNKVIREGFYENGMRKGLQTDYFDDGQIKSTMEFDEQGFVIWELNTETHDNQVIHGTGKFTMPYYSFEEVNQTMQLKEGTLQGEFRSGKRVGKWTYLDQTGVLTDEETYSNGVFSERASFKNSNRTVQETKKTIIVSIESLIMEAFAYDETAFTNLNQYLEQNTPPLPPHFQRNITFPGGIKKLLLLIALNLRFDIEENLMIRITVDEQGHLIKVKSSVFVVGLGDEVNHAMKSHETKLLPAIADGKPALATMIIPVSNSQQWIHYLQTAPADDVELYVQEVNK
jgi:antitoxin component YwqK of YwqJK toxin-antitoxin module